MERTAPRGSARCSGCFLLWRAAAAAPCRDRRRAAFAALQRLLTWMPRPARKSRGAPFQKQDGRRPVRPRRCALLFLSLPRSGFRQTFVRGPQPAAKKQAARRCCRAAFLSLFLPLPAQKEQRNGARAGVGADDGAHIVEHHRLAAKPLFYHLRHPAGVLRAVAVADEYGLPAG